MKEHRTKSMSKHNESTRSNFVKSSKCISTKDEFLKQYILAKGEKRFDRDFTLSWGKKHESSKEKMHTGPVFLKTKQNSRSYCNSPTSSNSPHYLGQNYHFSDLKSELRHKSKLYKEEVYELRYQNEENVIQTLNMKKQHNHDFNKIAQQYSLKNYRSGGLTLTPKTKMSLNSSLSHPSQINGITSNCLTENGPEFVTEWDSSEDNSDFHVYRPLKSHFAQQNVSKERSHVLKGLEEIYFKDLNKEKASRIEANRFENSPYNKDYLNKIKNYVKTHENEILKASYDENLFKRLNDPYGEKIVFLKPNHAKFQNQNVKIDELHAKAEILRNIKSIDETIMTDYKKSFEFPYIKAGLGTNISPKSKQIEKSYRFKEHKLQRKEKRPISETP